jgi:hypothetical protein
MEENQEYHDMMEHQIWKTAKMISELKIQMNRSKRSGLLHVCPDRVYATILAAGSQPLRESLVCVMEPDGYDDYRIRISPCPLDVLIRDAIRTEFYSSFAYVIPTFNSAEWTGIPTFQFQSTMTHAKAYTILARSLVKANIFNSDRRTETDCRILMPEKFDNDWIFLERDDDDDGLRYFKVELGQTNIVITNYHEEPHYFYGLDLMWDPLWEDDEPEKLTDRNFYPGDLREYDEMMARMAQGEPVE